MGKSSLHPAVIEAVRETVENQDQPSSVADRLLIWMDAVARGDSSLDEPSEVSERLDTVFSAMEVDTQ